MLINRGYQGIKEMQGTFLVKRVTREFDEQMEDVKGRGKRRAVCYTNSSVEAGEQPRRQQ